MTLTILPEILIPQLYILFRNAFQKHVKLITKRIISYVSFTCTKKYVLIIYINYLGWDSSRTVHMSSHPQHIRHCLCFTVVSHCLICYIAVSTSTLQSWEVSLRSFYELFALLIVSQSVTA
jgi:hypothetical protein